MLTCIYRFCLLCIFIIPLSVDGQYNLDSLKLEVQNNPDRVLTLMEQGQIPSLEDEARTLLVSLAYLQKGDYLKVDSLIQSAFQSYTFSQDSGMYVQYLIVLAKQRKIINDFESSLTHLFELVDYCNRNKDTLNLISVYIHLSETYRAIEKHDEGLASLTKAEELIEAYGEDFPLRILAKLYDRKVALLSEKNAAFDLIIDLSLETIEIASKLEDKDLEASLYNGLGYLYINQKPENPNPIAEEYFLRAIQLWDELGSAIYATNARLNLSRYYNRTKEYNKGLQVLLPIHDLVDSSDWIWEKGGFYEMMGRLSYGNKDFESAYLYSGRAKSKRLELGENQYNKQLALLSVKHNLQQEKAKFTQQKKEAELAKLETRAKEDENRILYLSLLAVFIVALAIFLFLIISNQQKRKLRKQQKENEIINEQLSDAVSQKETLLSEVNHRVKNNLSILSSLLYLQQKKALNPEIKSSINKSRDRINTMALVHESLYQRDDMEHVDFQEYLTKLIHSIKSIYWNDRPIALTIHCEDLSPDLSTSVPLAMIINELVTNSFKYAFHKITSPKIEVIFQENTIQYMDNGKGVKSNPENSSLGSKIITLFSEQIHASVHSFTNEDGFHHHIKLSEQ